jgi:hypothetical protein
VSTNERFVQDRRRFSRLSALTDCEFTFKELPHKAVIVDLSLIGALLSSKFLPPRGSSVKILLQPPHLKEPLTLDGTVVRGGWGTSDQGEISRFAVQFDSLTADLIRVLNRLQTKMQSY